METKNLNITVNKHKCRINGRKGILRTVSVDEIKPNGKTQTVHTDMHFISSKKKNNYDSLLRLLSNAAKGRAA